LGLQTHEDIAKVSRSRQRSIDRGSVASSRARDCTYLRLGWRHQNVAITEINLCQRIIKR
jgi:hypothetical protein